MINFAKTLAQTAVFTLAFSFSAADARTLPLVDISANTGDPVDVICAPCTGTPNPGATTRIPAIGWSTGTETFTFGLTNQTAGDGVTYQWQKSIDYGTTYTNFPGGGPTIQTMIPETSYFRCIVTCTATGQSAISTPMRVNFSLERLKRN